MALGEQAKIPEEKVSKGKTACYGCSLRHITLEFPDNPESWIWTCPKDPKKARDEKGCIGWVHYEGREKKPRAKSS